VRLEQSGDLGRRSAGGEHAEDFRALRLSELRPSPAMVPLRAGRFEAGLGALLHHLCNALAQGACPIALLVGDFAMAERYTALLRSHLGKNTLGVWRAYADCFDGERLIRCGDLDTGLSLLRPAVDELWRARFVQVHTAFVVALALGLVQAGRAADARIAIDKALERCARTGESWALAELHRARGKMLLGGKASGANQNAEMVFLQALNIAREQKVLSWELRTATSLARLWCDQGRSAEATALLQPVYDRFTEGFDTADLKAAKALLEALAEPNAPRTRIS
jgi:predicted ATPase